MMTNKLLSQAVLLAICFTVFLPRLSDGFNAKAHEMLSKLAVDPTLTNASQLDSFLKSILSFEFENGVDEPIQGGLSVKGLIADGSVNEDKPAGNYKVQWNASNYSSGIYLYKLQAGSYTQVKRLLLLK